MAGIGGPILLTGAGGQVGGELLPLLQALGPVVAPTREELDLGDEAAIRALVTQVQPRWIVNPAAYTAVDKAEAEPEIAFAINRDAVRVLGEEAARLGAGVVHFSTDYVFQGDGDRPWREDDATGPLGVYGASKLAGEEALAASGAAHLIFRTSWVYGARGKNFLLTILRAARERPELRIVDDQFGAPTWARDLADLTLHAMTHCEARGAETGLGLQEAAREVSGAYHASGAGCTTWFGFANEFLGIAREAEPGQAFAKCVPVPSESYPTPARRPRNSRMDCTKVARVFGWTMPPWQASTAAVMDELLGKAALGAA